MNSHLFRNRETSLEIIPISHRLQAKVHVPGSKSLTNRALLIAALADGTSSLKNALFSDDSLYFARALRQLGFDVSLDEQRSEMVVKGLGGKIPSTTADLFIGNAGTAARFLTTFLTLGHGYYTLDGDARMRERPIGELGRALEQLGAHISIPQTFTGTVSADIPNQNTCPFVQIYASGLSGGIGHISGNVSSQFLSGLLMVSPYSHNPVELHVTTKLNSRPYVDMTISIMAEFGIDVRHSGYATFTIPLARYQARESYAIESDASAASYFFAAAAIMGGTVRVENLTRSSKQGDIEFLNILQEMGCTVFEGCNFLEVTGPGSLQGVDVDMRDISDTAQTLAVIAPFAKSPTRIRGIGFIRRKETDRISATSTELTRLGVSVREDSDGMIIQPCQEIKPTLLHTYNDHRMAMSFALIGLRTPGVSIENPACVSKTFPEYFQVLDGLK